MLSLLNTTFTNTLRQGFTLIGRLLSKLKARSTYFENQAGTKVILKEIDSAGLLEKASIVTTPTAYSDGFLHSVKPEQTLGSELVTNGDFSNGSTNWVIENTWTISNGLASGNGADGGGAELKQNTILLIGVKYKLTYEIKNYVSGTIRGATGAYNSGNGIYTDYFISSRTALAFGGSNFFGDITNISAKEVTDADFTFTRNNIGTRVNSSGNIESIAGDLPRIDYLGGSGSWLLEPEATNTATDSNDFTTGQIFVSSSNASLTNGVTLTANATTSPEGLTNASKLQIGTTNQAFNRLRYAGVITVSGNVNTLSIFAKKGSGVDWLGIFVDGIDASSRGWFDLENGVLGSKSAAVVNHKIEDYGNGWYRCLMSFTTSVDTNGVVSFVITDGNGNTSYSGNLTDHHFIYGLQAESHATREYATSYIPTSGSPQTRGADSATDAGSSDLISSTEGALYAEISASSNEAADYRVIALGDGNDVNNYVLLGIDPSVNAFYAAISGVTIGFTIPADATIFLKLAIRYKNNESKFFVNGVQVGTTNTTATMPSGLNRLAFDLVGTGPFEGNVRCVAVFKEALTDQELIALTS